jgi:NAD(P)-dependent dehydrogenase (short-subunit alcohol dehydrogenase family)
MSPSTITAPCADKTVVITGAAQGLGQAAAVAFAAAGAKRIAIVDSSCTSDTIERASQAAAEAGRTEPELFSFHLNLGEAASIDTEFTEIHSRLGHVDVLINTTEHISLFNLQRGTIEASNVDKWWKSWETSVKDAFVVARALLPLLLKGTEKTIVNVISARSPLLQFTSEPHDLSELAMMHLSEGLMLEYGNEGLLAYSLQPGHQGAKDVQQSVNQSK